MPAWAVFAVTLLCLIPLFVTPILPLVDFYSHMARYFVLAKIDTIPSLDTYYTARWTLLPNLGLDILGTGMMTVLPPLLVPKLIGIIIVLAPLAGVLALSAALHGRITAPALFLGGVLSYSHILIWGFANFLLGLGLILGGLALWIALRHRPGWQMGLTLPLAMVLFFVHGLAFAFWGLLLGCVELMLAREDRDLRPGPLLRRMGRLALLALGPVLLFLQMPTAGAEGGITPSFANLRAHAEGGTFWPRVFEEILLRIDATLRVADSDLPWIDRGLGLLLWGGLAAAFWTGALRLDPRLWLAAAMAAVLTVVMPPAMFGVGHLNERAPLILLALLAAGAVPAAGLGARAPILVALAGLFVLRSALVTGSWAQNAPVYRSYMATLEQHDTGPLAMSVVPSDRDPGGPRCSPLRAMMLLRHGTAVKTFSHATQQPLITDPPLARLRGAADLPVAADKGVSAIVTCAYPPDTPPYSTPPGFVEIAAVAPWQLFVLASDDG